MADIRIIFRPILIKDAKIGTYQTYKDYGMQFFTVLDVNGNMLKTGMTPSGNRIYNNGAKAGYTLDTEFMYEMPIIRDNPDVANDATGNYPGNY